MTSGASEFTFASAPDSSRPLVPMRSIISYTWRLYTHHGLFSPVHNVTETVEILSSPLHALQDFTSTMKPATGICDAVMGDSLCNARLMLPPCLHRNRDSLYDIHRGLGHSSPLRAYLRYQPTATGGIVVRSLGSHIHPLTLATSAPQTIRTEPR
jgi:hypothetical protein